MNNERRIAVDLRVLIESTLHLSWKEQRTHGRFVTRYGPNVPPVMANESRLAEMFRSVIGTAAHAVDNGVASGEVYVTTCVDYSGNAVVEICDTGIGISVDTLDRMFTPLFTTKVTRLELSTCRRIVAELGGELAVECVVGKGTTVTITLPKAVSAVRERVARTTTDLPHE